MTKTSLCTILLVLAVTAARPVSAEEPGTFIRVTARPILSGHTEVVIHKAYAGQSGPIHDIITLQSPGADGYPKVEMTTSGALKATRECGGIVIESTGPGLGEIDVFITYSHLQSTT